MNNIIKKILKLFNILRDPVFIRALLKGAAAGTEHYQVLNGLDCSHVVDIGANRGQFALFSRKCFPNARIDSFEPLSEPANQFERVFAGDENTYLHRLAIGESEGEKLIHVSLRDDSSSLLPISEAQTTLFPGTGERETRTIRVAQLSSILSGKDVQSPALLKLDVQGYELQALKGCEIFLHCFDYVYVECSFVELYTGQSSADEVIAWLREHGLILSGVYNLCYDSLGKAIQGDFMFSRRTE